DSNSIINNNVSNNLGNGIYLFESRGNTIADNMVTGNAGACIKLVWFPWKWDHYFIVLNDIHGNVGCSDPQWSEPIASWSTIGIIAAAIACCALVCRHLKRGTAPGTRPSLIRTPDQASC
ncbi:MAG: NosD domain-containing protein, partial [Candidatus Sigynarchaeota archaeon]